MSNNRFRIVNDADHGRVARGRINLADAQRYNTAHARNLANAFNAAALPLPPARSEEGKELNELYGRRRQGVRNINFIQQRTTATALVRRVGGRADNGGRIADRYFHIQIRVGAGQGLTEAAGDILDEIHNGRTQIQRAVQGGRANNSAWNDEFDVDDSNYELVRISNFNMSGERRRAPRALSYDLEVANAYEGGNDLDSDFTDEDYIGQHQYQFVPLEQFAMKPLLMRDFTCIYESLMIIKLFADYEGNNPPAMGSQDWRIYVLVHFNAEPFKIQQMFYDSYIMPCVDYFVQQYKIPVRLFNAIRFQEEYQRVVQLEEEEQGGSSLKYFLVYWGEHVFPCIREKLPEVCQFQQQFLSGNRRATDVPAAQEFDDPLDQEEATARQYLFMVMPPIMQYLHLEVKCACFPQTGNGGRLANNEYLFEAIPGFRFIDIIIHGKIAGRSIYDFKKQVEVINEYKEKEQLSIEELTRDLFQQIGQCSEQTRIKRVQALRILERRSKQLYYTANEMAYYHQMKDAELAARIIFRQRNLTEEQQQQQLSIFQETASTRSRIYRVEQHRRKQFFESGRAVIDLETYVDNSDDRQTYYNMVPFCASLVGDLQRLETYYMQYESRQGSIRKQRIVMDRGINKIFLGFNPRECIRKLIRFLLENNYCHVLADHRDINSERATKRKPMRLFNYIFAHNGFGFDFKFMYEELHTCMREFSLIGDMNQTKSLQGNGLFFYDFSLIYREKLSTLAKTFFPDQEHLWKYECNLVINLEKERLKSWFIEAEQAGITPFEQPELKQIIEYCRQDSQVLFNIVNDFFLRAYTTPFGYSFLPKMFYHSLSEMAYSMFTTCYLTRPIYVNRDSLQIELDTKQGGCTGANSNIFGISVFVDENSYYPSIMQNEMPVEYEIPTGNPYVTFTEPVILTRENFADYVKDVDICRVTFRFPADCVLPTISQKSRDTLVLVLESDDYDTKVNHTDANTTTLYGYAVRVAFEEVEGTEMRLFGKIAFKTGDAIFKDFISDQYRARQQCKARGDSVGDIFHKNIMNSSQGKFGLKLYKNVKFGGVSFARDVVSYLQMRDDVQSIDVKQILTDQVDLYEVRWECDDDKWLAKGNTVRIPAYIMAVARAHLLRIQNCIAREFGNPHVIAYYDTDSILIRFDLLDPSCNQ